MGYEDPVPTALSPVLHWSAEVVRTPEGTSIGTQYFRVPGSAGNLHRLDVYVVAGATVYAFDPLPYRLITIGEDVPPGPTTLVISGVP